MIKVTNPSDCCGCTACYSICKHNAINLRTDSKGFIYPQFDEVQCIDCGLCNNVCPIVNAEKRNENFKQIFAVRLKDETILKKSSSGGAFYAIASYVIKELHGVVFGVEYDNEMTVRHNYTETLEGLRKFHGSKYVQSATTGIYNEVLKKLKEERYVLFSGTPCQIMALRLFLHKKYEKLICIDLICHSVPSPLIFKNYVDYVSRIHKSRLIGLDMRNKSKGWSHLFYYYYYFANGMCIGDEKLKCEHWGKLFFSGLITRPSCNECRFTNYRRTGDITIADFWDDDLKRPECFSEKGTSLVIVSTDTGDSIVEKIKENIHIWALSKSESYQPCLAHPYKANPKFNEFWDYYNKFGFEKAYRKYFVKSLGNRIKSKIKYVLKGINNL